MGPSNALGINVYWQVVSIQLIAPASGALNGSALMSLMPRSSFHSTDCPSEWGHWICPGVNAKFPVSIQLIAPASGATIHTPAKINGHKRFHSTDCPSEWGFWDKVEVYSGWGNGSEFPFN